MGIIIALSGKKGSGKSTLANEMSSWYSDEMGESAFVCSFADDLKEFCINVLELRREQCYGSDDDKNTPTNYLWDNMSHFLRWKFGSCEYILKTDRKPLKCEIHNP